MLYIIVPGLHELTALTLNFEGQDAPDDVYNAEDLAAVDLDILEVVQLLRELEVAVPFHKEVNLPHLVVLVEDLSRLRQEAGLEVRREPREELVVAIALVPLEMIELLPCLFMDVPRRFAL